MKLLHIDSSVQGDQSASRQLTAHVVERIAREQSGRQGHLPRSCRAPIAHLSAGVLGARFDATSAEKLDDDARRDIADGNGALDEFLAADVVVIGAPMYNFSIPSQLKAWIDRISVAGKHVPLHRDGTGGSRERQEGHHRVVARWRLQRRRIRVHGSSRKPTCAAYSVFSVSPTSSSFARKAMRTMRFAATRRSHVRATRIHIRWRLLPDAWKLFRNRQRKRPLGPLFLRKDDSRTQVIFSTPPI